MTLAPATPDDFAFTHDLTRDNMRGYVERFWGAWSPAVYADNYARTDNRVIRVGGERVGFVRLAVEAGDRRARFTVPSHPGQSPVGRHGEPCPTVPPTAHPAEVLVLEDLQVVPAWQGRGVGTWALGQVRELAAGRVVRLRCFHDNPAYRLYVRVGFVAVERGDHADWLEWPLVGPAVPDAMSAQESGTAGPTKP